MNTMIDKNEVKKDLYKTRANAFFTYYEGGILYYNVVAIGGVYLFPVDVVEDRFENAKIQDEDGYFTTKEIKVGIKLAEDIGMTKFNFEIKGSDLNRWINKAIDNEEFIKIG
jgi:hypothetical protein